MTQNSRRGLELPRPARGQKRARRRDGRARIREAMRPRFAPTIGRGKRASRERFARVRRASAPTKHESAQMKRATGRANAHSREHEKPVRERRNLVRERGNVQRTERAISGIGTTTAGSRSSGLVSRVGDEMPSQRHHSRETAIERSTDTARYPQLRTSGYHGNWGQTRKLGSDSIFIIFGRRCTEIRLVFF